MKIKRLLALTMAFALTFTATVGLTGCSANAASKEKVVFYSNADDEAVAAMQNALDNNGYKEKYIFQSFGTSELGGKLLAEGNNIEADFLTMSSYYVESAQAQKKMFKDLGFTVDTIDEYPTYAAPTTSQEGAIFVNTNLMTEKNLPMPTSIKDLANPVYEGMISVADINSSSTAWLFIQAIVSAYGDGDEAKAILKDIYKNAGPHIESSGSAPLKKVRAGEVAIGFGLRQQAVADKADGLPIDYIDPTEGNFSLVEVISVVDKGDKTNPLALEMVECIVKNARTEMLESYPNVLYNGETSTSEFKSKYPQAFSEPLTVDLLEKHIEFSNSCK